MALTAEPDEAIALAALVRDARQRLAEATTAAEVLDAKAMADIAYDTAKRLARKKAAHDSMVATAHRLQADALLMESQAKRRLADEYDAIPEEARDKGGGNEATRSTSERVSSGSLGLSRKQIHEARQVRDAERADPGVVERTVEAALDAGEEPTKAKVKAAVAKTLGRARAKTPATDFAPDPAARPDDEGAFAEATARKLVNVYLGTLDKPWFLHPPDEAFAPTVRRTFEALSAEHREILDSAARTIWQLCGGLCDD